MSTSNSDVDAVFEQVAREIVIGAIVGIEDHEGPVHWIGPDVGDRPHEYHRNQSAWRRGEDESGIVGGGIGGRHLFRPQDSLRVGLDVAQGPEGTVLYVQAGHAW
jgi:hypothetical protein